MNILLLTNMYPSNSAPNYGIFVKRTEEILKSTGHKITRVSMTKKTSKWKKILGYIIYTLKFFWFALSPKIDVIYVHYASQNAKLITLVNKIRPTIPIVLNVHGTDVLPQTEKQESYQPDVRKMVPRVSHVIVPSSYYEQVVREKYEYTGPITVYPSGGVNTEFFYPDETIKKQMRKTLNFEDSTTVIGYISRIDIQKGWDTLLEAIEIINLTEKNMLNDLRFIIAGDGAQEEALTKKVKELGLDNVIVKLPMLTQQEMFNTFNAMDAFCFPSFQESLGLVGLEAMACGLPIIASDIPGIKDYTKAKENAVIFEKGNPSMLADAIISFYRMDKEQRNILSKNALATAHLFDSKKISNLLFTPFENLLDE